MAVMLQKSLPSQVSRVMLCYQLKVSPKLTAEKNVSISKYLTFIFKTQNKWGREARRGAEFQNMLDFQDNVQLESFIHSHFRWYLFLFQ